MPRLSASALLASTLLAGTIFAGSAQAADGCPDGTFRFGETDDDTTHAVLFDAFIVTAGGAGPASASATCNIEVAPGTDGYSLYTAQHRGFAIIEDGQTATFTDPNGNPQSTAQTGPFNDNIPFDQLIALGPNEALRLDFTVELNAGTGPDAAAGLETSDYKRIGFTTLPSVQASMAAIANSVAAAMNQLRGTADYLLLGGIGPFDRADGFGVVAAAGSSLFGVTGRVSPTASLTLTGGAALFTQTAGAIDIGPSALLGGAVRYALPGTSPSRFFVEAGLTAAPQLDLTITRPYQNNGAMTEGTGTTNGHLLTMFGRAGTALDLGPAGDLVLTTTIARNALRVDAYAEPMTAANPFAASFDAARYAASSVSAALAWTLPIAETIDVTVGAELGKTFSNIPVTGDVGFIGPVTGSAAPGMFANASARLGYHPTDRLSLDTFVVGMKTAGANPEVQIGGALRFTF